MTPEERNLIIELFDRLSTLEDAQRDPEAERLIRDGLRQAPNAAYTLVQTVLVQDEALKQADFRIRELEGAVQGSPGSTSFLGNMRETVLGQGTGRGSVPSVRPGGTSSVWSTGAPAMPAGPGPGAAPGPAPAQMGGSFLGTAAAAAAGMIGGSLLMGGIRSAMGQPQQHGGQRAFDQPAGGASPWGGGGGGGGDLARQAGLDDIGRAPPSASGDGGSARLRRARQQWRRGTAIRGRCGRLRRRRW